MKSDLRDETPLTKLINRATPIPSVQVACSTWETDIPADQWTTCKLIPAVTPITPSTQPFTNWETPWLELVVAFAPGSSPLQAVEQANRVVSSLNRYAPRVPEWFDPARRASRDATRRCAAARARPRSRGWPGDETIWPHAQGFDVQQVAVRWVAPGQTIDTATGQVSGGVADGAGLPAVIARFVDEANALESNYEPICRIADLSIDAGAAYFNIHVNRPIEARRSLPELDFRARPRRE